MQSTTVRLITAAISIALFAALIGVVILTFRTEYAAIPTATPRPTPTSTATAAAIAEALPPADGATRLGSAGFAFQPLSGFAERLSETSAILTDEDAGSELAPVFLLSAGPRDQFVEESHRTLDEAFEHFVDFFAEQDNFAVGEVQIIEVAGVEGRAVDLTGNDESAPFAGRIAMAQPDAGRLFVMTGVAPQEIWRQEAAEQYATVLASVTFFAPEQTENPALLLVPTPTPTTEPTVTVAPTPTPIPASVSLPTPDPSAQVSELPAVYSNANFVHEADLANNTLWIAGEGGLVGWNLRSGGQIKFTAADGLAGNHFNTVAHCPLPGLGVIFGSDSGLHVFDTRNGSWNRLTSANSGMSYDDVSTVRCYQEDGFVVVGYQEHGLDIFDADTNAWTHYGRDDGLAVDRVEQAAVVGDREEIWVSSGLGISVLSSSPPAYYNSGNSPLTSNRIDSMIATEAGTLWIGGPGALHRIEDGRWTAYTDDVVAGPFPGGSVIGLDVDDRGYLWLASEEGEVCRFDADEAECVQFFQDEPEMPAASLTHLVVDADGTVYVSAYGNGMGIYDGEGWRTQEVFGEILAGNQVRSMVQTRDGSVWIAGDQGVQQINPIEPAIQRLYTQSNESLPIDDVRVLAADVVGLWLGGEGAATFDGEDWQVYTLLDGLAGTQVQAIALDSQLRAWLGTESGLSIWNGEAFFNLTAENGLPSDDITALLADGNAMWIGSNGGGLYRFTRNQLRIFTVDNADLPSDVITTLGLDEANGLWVGTENGLARFVDETAIVVEEIPAVPITAIATSSDEDTPAIWVGTEGDGLFRFDGQDWALLADSEPLPSAQIGAILLDSYDTVWIGGTRGGVTRLDAGDE